ncbi:MAG: MBL fold metallo-hydrolase [Stellaceae bacterium]
MRQIENLGFTAGDVRHIVLTHLDIDHAGGIQDFPDATVHVFGAELDAAKSQNGWLDRRRYLPIQWGRDANWQRYTPEGERWFGFSCVRELVRMPPDILMVCRSPGTPSVIAGSRYATWKVGCFTPATPISSAMKWLSADIAAPRCCALTSG